MGKGRSLERNVIKNLQTKMAKEKEKKAEKLKLRQAARELEAKVIKPKSTKPMDLEYARRYSVKAQNAFNLNHKFTLTFAQFKRLFNRKYCQLSGIELDTSDNNSPYYPTLDRVDNSKGYIHGNVACVASFVNQFKGYIENPINEMTFELASKVLKNTEKFIKKSKGA